MKRKPHQCGLCGRERRIHWSRAAKAWTCVDCHCDAWTELERRLVSARLALLSVLLLHSVQSVGNGTDTETDTETEK